MVIAVGVLCGHVKVNLTACSKWTQIKSSLINSCKLIKLSDNAGTAPPNVHANLGKIAWGFPTWNNKKEKNKKKDTKKKRKKINAIP